MYIVGRPDEEVKLVTIDQPNRTFRVGDNVEVHCRANSGDVTADWERYANQQRQYVDTYVSTKHIMNNALLMSLLIMRLHNNALLISRSLNPKSRLVEHLSNELTN